MLLPTAIAGNDSLMLLYLHLNHLANVIVATSCTFSAGFRHQSIIVVFMSVDRLASIEKHPKVLRWE